MLDRSPASRSTLAVIGDTLRERHFLRGLAYFGTGAAVLQSLAQFFPRRRPFSGEQLQLAVLPFTLTVTRAFAELRPEDRAQWQQPNLSRTSKQVLYGAAIGSAAILGTLGIAWAKGWLSAPAWGWEATPPASLARSVAMSTAGHLAVAINEELVFRGYGYTTMRLALPDPLAAAWVTGLFALSHPLRVRTQIGEAMLGLALLALRDASGGIWMPIGYHWAWNLLQTAVFGPPDRPTSLRPLQIHGPLEWVGRPGHPEPGVLSTAVNLAVALGVWAYQKQRLRP